MSLQGQRLLLAKTLLTCCFLLLVAKLSYIQLEEGDQWVRMAQARNAQTLSLENIPRGDIVDRRGQSLTGAHVVNRIAVFPAAVSNRDAAIAKLAQITGAPPGEIARYFDAGPCYLPYDLPPEKVQIVNEMAPGISVLPVEYRYGPDPLAVHLTGHVGKIPSRATLDKLLASSDKNYKLGDWIGVMGLEKHYERWLKGSYPTRQAYILSDARGRMVARGKVYMEANLPDPGRYNVVTTLDARVQRVVENVLDREVEKGAVVVMKAGSGDILACASRPDFNPHPLEISPASAEKGAFLNRAFSYFPPGSLFKLVLACAALEEKIAEPGSTFSCQGAQDQPIRCWHNHGHGTITLHDAVVHSCNPAFVELGYEMGAGKIITYAQRLGLDNELITGLPAREDELQSLDAIAHPHNLANSSIGQGPVLASPVQLTAMMNVFATGGLYYQPRLVREISSPGGEKITFPVSPGQRVVTKETANSVAHMLAETTKKGVGKKAYISPYGTAGKTGSAEVRAEGHETVYAWFSGYVPFQHPRYVITVLIQGAEGGGQTAAPLFREIAAQLVKLKLDTDNL